MSALFLNIELNQWAPYVNTQENEILAFNQSLQPSESKLNKLQSKLSISRKQPVRKINYDSIGISLKYDFSNGHFWFFYVFNFTTWYHQFSDSQAIVEMTSSTRSEIRLLRFSLKNNYSYLIITSYNVLLSYSIIWSNYVYFFE